MKDNLKNTLTVAMLTVLSQILGYVREMLFAYYLGTSMPLEAFQTAETVPLTFTQILISAVPLAFTPMLIRTEKEDKDTLIYNAFALFGIVLLPICFMVGLHSDIFVKIIAPGFEGDKLVMTSHLVSILSPNIIFLSLVALYNSFLNAKREFIIPTASALILNVCIISAQVLTKANVVFVALGSSIGGIIMFGCTCVFCYKKYGIRMKFERIRIQCIRKILGSIFPVCIISAFTSLNLVLDKFFASKLQGGSIAVLMYGYKIINLPVYLFVTSVTKVMLPEVTQMMIDNNYKKLNQIIRQVVFFCIVGGVAFVFAIAFLGKWIVTILFGRGAFNATDIVNTVNVLKVYAFGVTAMALNSFFQSISYARGRYLDSFSALIAQSIVYVLSVCLLISKYGLMAIAFGNVVANNVAIIIWIVVLYRKYNINIVKNYSN